MTHVHRLRSTRDFQRLRAAGRSGRSDGIVAQVAPHEGPARFGVTVGARTGGAVVRNRLRRRLKAAYRAHGPTEGVDVVLIARPSATELTYQQLENHVVQALSRAGV